MAEQEAGDAAHSRSSRSLGLEMQVPGMDPSFQSSHYDLLPTEFPSSCLLSFLSTPVFSPVTSFSVCGHALSNIKSLWFLLKLIPAL